MILQRIPIELQSSQIDISREIPHISQSRSLPHCAFRSCFFCLSGGGFYWHSYWNAPAFPWGVFNLHLSLYPPSLKFHCRVSPGDKDFQLLVFWHVFRPRRHRCTQHPSEGCSIPSWRAVGSPPLWNEEQPQKALGFKTSHPLTTRCTLPLNGFLRRWASRECGSCG